MDGATCRRRPRHAPRIRAALPVLAVAALLAAAPARAIDLFEIQVYDAEIDERGHFGLELHANYALEGRRTPDYPGETPPNHVFRLTLEPSFGVTDWLELGVYLQAFLPPGAPPEWGGWKLRTKFVVPERAGLPVFLGLNIELGNVPKSVEQQAWANEFRPIIGWTDGLLFVSVNPILGWALSGPEKFRLEFEPAAKASVNTQRGFAIGVEYYAGLGFLNGFAPPSQREQLLFGVLDLAKPRGAPPSPWELNVGVGASLGPVPQQLIGKLIVGREL